MKEIKAKKLLAFDEKSKGLLGKKKAENVYFTTRFGIHTFFMKFSIDVVILTKDNKVAKVKKCLRPNRIFLWNPIFSKVLELECGSIEKLKLKKGDEIKIISA